MVQTGLPCWGSELISGRGAGGQRRQRLDDLKGFLESLQAFNTAGKLKNFSRSVTEILAQKANLDLVKQVDGTERPRARAPRRLTGYLDDWPPPCCRRKTRGVTGWKRIRELHGGQKLLDPALSVAGPISAR